MRRPVSVVTASLPFTYVEDDEVPFWEKRKRLLILAEREAASRITDERQLKKAKSCNPAIDI